MILASKEIFIPKYLDGSKLHSIREGHRWREGLTIHHYANVRQTGMYKFMPDRVCKGVQDIFITFNGHQMEISIDNKYQYYPEKLRLAINDGFDGYDSFLNFFFPKGDEGPFSGQIVHWTDLKY